MTRRDSEFVPGGHFVRPDREEQLHCVRPVASWSPSWSVVTW